MLLKHSFFENLLLLPTSRNSLRTPSSDYSYTWGKFYILKLNYFSGRPNKVKKRCFFDHYASVIGNKNIAVK